MKPQYLYLNHLGFVTSQSTLTMYHMTQMDKTIDVGSYFWKVFVVVVVATAYCGPQTGCFIRVAIAVA